MANSQADGLQGIGSFQFENLIKNRIPFLLLHFGQTFEGLFLDYHAKYAASQSFDLSTFVTPKSFFQKHILRQILSKTEIETILKTLETKVTSKDQALVILCEDGQKSQKLFEVFSELGYGNAFWIVDGMQGLRRDLLQKPS